MNLAKVVGPRAPRRRSHDSWRAYVPGLVIIGGAILLHNGGYIGEHLTGIVMTVGGTRLPIGRVRDGKRWKLASDTRTDEHRRDND